MLISKLLLEKRFRLETRAATSTHNTMHVDFTKHANAAIQTISDLPNSNWSRHYREADVTKDFTTYAASIGTGNSKNLQSHGKRTNRIQLYL